MTVHSDAQGFYTAMPEVFFTSYARRDNDEGLLRNTVREISRRVRANLGLGVDPDEIAFFDATDIQTGMQWQQVLGDALRRIRVLVCMCSPTSLNSEYCAKEFELFRLRVKHAGDNARGKVVIVPVIWERGTPRMTLPDVIADYQTRDDRMPSGYQVHGLSRLARFESQKQTYTETLEVLAEIIGNAYADPALTADWPAPVDFEQLPRWFHRPEEGRFNLAVSVLHPSGTQWRPDGLRSIGAAVDKVTKDLNLAWRELPTNPSIAQLAADARAQGQGSLVIVDANAVAEPSFSALLGLLEAAANPHTGFVVGLPGKNNGAPGAAEVAAELQRLIPRHSQVGCVAQVFAVTDPKSIERALNQVATALQIAALNTGPVRPVESDDLANRALAVGITNTKPIVTATPAGQP